MTDAQSTSPVFRENKRVDAHPIWHAGQRLGVFVLTALLLACSACADDTSESGWTLDEFQQCDEPCERTALLRTQDDTLDVVIEPTVRFEIERANLALCETAQHMAECLGPPSDSGCIIDGTHRTDNLEDGVEVRVGRANGSEVIARSTDESPGVDVKVILRVPGFFDWNDDAPGSEEQFSHINAGSTVELQRTCTRGEQTVEVDYEIGSGSWYRFRETSRPQVTAIDVRATPTSGQDVPDWCGAEVVVLWGDLE